jgi:ribosomal protection tetracycline resistance protein
MGAVTGIGTAAAAVTSAGDGVPLAPDAIEALAEHDDGLLAAYVAGTPVPPRRLRQALAELTSRCLVHPVFFGSARTGAGIDDLVVGIRRLLPAAPADADAPPSATVFAVERAAAGEKRAYVRMHRGTLRVRDRVPSSSGRTDRVTAVAVSAPGGLVPRPWASAGEIARVGGLAGARVGDSIGERSRTGSARFAPPSLETVVVPDDPAEAPAVHHALALLAEADPLIGLRRDDVRRETRVSLYGEVQQEVLQATLAEEHGLHVSFRGSRTLCVECPLGAGEAHERMGAEGNPFLATVGLQISPVPAGSGVTFELGVELGSMPAAFFAAVEATVRETLTQGLRGWDVPDCLVRMTDAGYAPRQSAMHARFDKSMSSTGADFRGLTPLVVVAALRRAGTVVLEPYHRVTVDVPPDTVGAVWSLVSRLGGLPQGSLRRAGSAVVEGVVPAARLDELRRGLPGLTRGEAVLDSAFESYRPVTGEPPGRPWIGPDPRHREEYLLAVRQGRRD